MQISKKQKCPFGQKNGPKPDFEFMFCFNFLTFLKNIPLGGNKECAMQLTNPSKVVYVISFVKMFKVVLLLVIQL